MKSHPLLSLSVSWLVQRVQYQEGVAGDVVGLPEDPGLLGVWVLALRGHERHTQLGNETEHWDHLSTRYWGAERQYYRVQV
ncbi:MAG TPA: hypothetical protein VFK94_01175 [Patescibacteria group bacterium]|nr:hypothetical protein [Patescibacteria group bacterium]